MAQSNGLNPQFPGPVTAAGFDALHGNGVATTAKSTNGTSSTYVSPLGTVTAFAGTITSFHAISEGSVSATISLSVGGNLIATLSQGSTTGALVGPTTVFTPTAFNVGSTVGIYSSSALTQGAAKVILTYAVANV